MLGHPAFDGSQKAAEIVRGDASSPRRSERRQSTRGHHTVALSEISMVSVFRRSRPSTAFGVSSRTPAPERRINRQTRQQRSEEGEGIGVRTDRRVPAVEASETSRLLSVQLTRNATTRTPTFSYAVRRSEAPNSLHLVSSSGVSAFRRLNPGATLRGERHVNAEVRCGISNAHFPALIGTGTGTFGVRSPRRSLRRFGTSGCCGRGGGRCPGAGWFAGSRR